MAIKALEKLLDYTASGIGAVAGPMFASWRARQEADARRIAAQGDADALLIIAAAQSEARAILTSTASDAHVELDIAESVRQRIQFQEEKRHRNIGSVVGKAKEQLGDREVPDQEPDHDWTARFFNYIQDVSSAEMQSLWAKVLAGEIEQPGSVSIRALSILRNLDQPTAQLFQRLCSCCVTMPPDGNSIHFSLVSSLGGNAGANSLLQYGFTFDNLNTLNEHGLIINDYNAGYDMIMCVGVFVNDPAMQVRLPFRFQDRYWVLVESAEAKIGSEYMMRGICLSQAGKELSRIVECQIMAEYHQALERFFASQGMAMTEVDGPKAEIWEPGNR